MTRKAFALIIFHCKGLPPNIYEKNNLLYSRLISRNEPMLMAAKNISKLCETHTTSNAQFCLIRAVPDEFVCLLEPQCMYLSDGKNEISANGVF